MELGKGLFVSLVLDHGPSPLLAELVGPNGALIIHSLDPEYGESRLPFLTGSDGTYSLSISSRDQESENHYRLWIDEAREETPQDAKRVEADRLYEDGQELRVQWNAESLHNALIRFASALACNGDDPVWKCRCLCAMGEVYEEIGDLARSYQYYDQAVQMSSTLELGSQPAALIGLARIYGKRVELAKSLETSSRALDICRATGDRYHEALALDAAGVACLYAGKLRDSISYFQRALSIFSAVGDRRGNSKTLTNLCYAYATQGDFETALDLEENQALPLLRATGNMCDEAKIKLDAGITYGIIGEPQKALDLIASASDVFVRIGDRASEAACSNALGEVLTGIGDLDKALVSYKKASDIFHSLGDLYGETAATSLLGLTYLLRGDYDLATRHYEDVLAKAEHLGQPLVREFAHIRAGNAYAAREPQKAIFHYQEGLSIAVTEHDKGGEAESLNGIGYVYSMLGRNKEALGYYARALSIRNETRDRGGQALVLFNMARAKRDSGDLSGARIDIEKSLKTDEDVRAKVISQDLRASYLGTIHQRYELYTDVLVGISETSHSNDIEFAAFASAERSRARCLLEMLAEARVDVREGVDPALLQAERSLLIKLDAKGQSRIRLLSRGHSQEEASEVEKEWSSLYAQYQDTQVRVKSRSPKYAALTQPTPIGAKEVQDRLLDENTILLEYSLGEERSFLWAVTKTDLVTYILPPRKTIEELATRVYKALGYPEPFVASRAKLGDQTYWQLATRLSRMLLAPIASQLGKKRLLVVPDGALQYIPLAALPIPSTARRPEARNAAPVPMLSEHEIINLPSASTLAVMRQELKDRKPAPKAIAVFANPVFSKDDPRIATGKTSGGAKGSDLIAGLRHVMRGAAPGEELRLPALFSSQDEAEAIKGIVPESERLIETGLEASRDNVKKPEISQYRVIHFATHGLFDADNPERSGIVLSMFDAQGNLRDGVLRLHDIYNINLPAELVVLSACNTALGKDIKGEGLIGLTRGFMYAGAARVISSLWKVDDEASAELMRRFYQKMLKEGERPAAALRSAQIEMLNTRRWSSPRHWAGFIIQGEWK
jgi:CHAT domain-containing protein/tetratricopeptide (TPR) repeat protein